MTILKIIFLSLLCLPLLYIAIMLLDKLISEMKAKNSEEAGSARLRMRNIIHSDRGQYNQTYYQTRLEPEAGRRRPYYTDKRQNTRSRRRER